ncbi:type II toxin-antitoxin system HicA family toxin [Rheinheimera sp.]
MSPPRNFKLLGYQHPDHKLPLTIPHPKKDLGIGLVKKIRKEAGL